MKTLTLLALFSFALTSCSTRVVQNDDEREAFNMAVQGKVAQIKFDGKSPLWGRQIKIVEKYITFNDKSGNFYRFSPDSIKTISFTTNRVSTGLKCAGIIFGSCVIIGIVAEASVPTAGDPVTPGEIAFGFGILLSPVGFLVGYLMGENVQYTFK